MELEVLDAAKMLRVRIIVGRRCERAVRSNPGHPLINTTINLTPD
jgi:hypothetical protein